MEAHGVRIIKVKITSFSSFLILYSTIPFKINKKNARLSELSDCRTSITSTPSGFVASFYPPCSLLLVMFNSTLLIACFT
jgi:hypothetical protein